MSAGRIARAVESAWAGTAPRDRVLQAMLGPLAAGYGAAVALRNALYDRGVLRTHRLPAAVLSVGNLTVGGSGKTPTALWLADVLAQRGHRVGLVARGYGKRRAGVVVVGDGRPIVEPADGGDEAVLLAARSALPVISAERRVDAVRVAIERFGCNVVVLDDGFQHRALARDADLVLVPADGLPARLLPAGPLREPASALGRARAVLALGDETALPPRPSAPPGTPTFAGRVVPTGVVTGAAAALERHELDQVPRDRVVAVAGVARPERFWGLLDRLGVRAIERLRFPDHHAYEAHDLARIRAAAADGAHPVVTTEKDLVKLAGLPGADALRLHAIRIDVVIEDADRLVDVLLAPPQVALRRD